MDDTELLNEYARQDSERAFRALVERYVPLVYSAALRQVREPALAEDVTQVVFILLARKAGQLSKQTLLPGWLYRTAQHAAAKALRTEQRRRRRELEAVQMATDNTETGWEELAPFLDDAMAQLDDTDRGAVLLRYFRNRSLKDVGDALNLSEDAAQKRVARAVAKLRGLLLRRGVTASAVALTGLLSTHAAQIAPTGLAARVAAAALSKAVMPASIAGLLPETVHRSPWPRVVALGTGTLVLVIGIGLMIRVWPAPPADSSSLSFDTRIVAHARTIVVATAPPVRPLAPIKPVPVAVKTAPPLDQNQTGATRRLPVVPTRPALPAATNNLPGPSPALGARQPGPEPRSEADLVWVPPQGDLAWGAFPGQPAGTFGYGFVLTNRPVMFVVPNRPAMMPVQRPNRPTGSSGKNAGPARPAPSR